MITEIARYPDLETGGVILGFREIDEIVVVEAVDAGINPVRKLGYFSYDREYIKHVINILIPLYERRIEIIGVWHKHNNNMNPAFSYNDIITHKKFVDDMNDRGLSILFQKCNGQNYKLRTFIISNDEDDLKEIEWDNDELNSIFKYLYC